MNPVRSKKPKIFAEIIFRTSNGMNPLEMKRKQKKYEKRDEPERHV